MFRVIPELAVYLIFIHPFHLSPLIHLACPSKFCITWSRLHFLLLGITVVPREIKDNVWAKSCGQDVGRRIMGDVQIANSNSCSKISLLPYHSGEKNHYSTNKS